MKKLLAEYEIRFHDTDEILESSAFNPKDFVNKREYSIQINENRISNENGVVYKGGKWATAKLTEKPERWVVERNENHPMWVEFMAWWNEKYSSILFNEKMARYIQNNGKRLFELINAKDHQFLTLDQWAEFYLPKVDFSIHNETDWFFVKTNNNRWLSRGNLTEGDCASFNLRNKILDTKGHLVDSKNDIIELRKPTKEEMNVLYENAIKYFCGICWNKIRKKDE